VSAPGAGDDRAAVGNRIEQARRERGLTQAELAVRIGVTPQVLDRYERGDADASDTLARIAEVTDKPVSWFAEVEDEVSGAASRARIPTEVGERIAESRGRSGMTRQELAEALGVSSGEIERYESGAQNPAALVERIAIALGEPRTWLESGDPAGRVDEHSDTAGRTDEQESRAGGTTSAQPSAEPEAAGSPSSLPAPLLPIHVEDLPRKTRGYDPRATAELFDQVRDMYGLLWEERSRLEHQLDSLKGTLAEEERRHAETADMGARLEKELERANANQQALSDLLEQARLQKLKSRRQDEELPQRVTELESQLQLAEERASGAMARLEQAEPELERLRRHERSLAEAEQELERVRERERLRPAAEELERFREQERSLAEAEQELERFRERERSLAEALVWARHNASELTENAERKAETIVEEAERRAAELVSEAQHEVERLAGERRRLESLTHELQEDLSEFLRGTLDRLDERGEPTVVSDEPVA
jgi:transcriptional regulator with XRE-family HTH domain